MEIKEFARQHKVGVTIGGIIIGLVAYANIDDFLDPMVEGEVIQEATVPPDIPEKSQQTFPYWVDIQTENLGVLRLNFDTHDMSYDNKNHREKSGLFIRFGGVGDFEGEALKLAERIQVGNRLKAIVDEHSGIERNVESIQAIYR